MEYFSILSYSKLAHRGKKGIITYYHKNGTQKSTKTSVETDAKILQHKWDSDLFYSDNGLLNKNKSWEDFKQEYLASYPSDRVQTLAKLHNTIKKFESIVRPGKLSAVSMQQCEVWIKERLKVNLPQSVDTERRYLRPMFNKALQWGYIERNPFADIRRIKHSIPETPALTVDQALATLYMVERHEPERLLLAEFAYETGMRLGEIARQRIEDIDFTSGFARVEAHAKGCSCWHCEREGKVGWSGKAGVPRLVPLSSRMTAQLLTRFQTQKTGAIFPAALNTIIGVLHRAHTRAKFRGKAATHIFRHTLATDMERAGVRMGVIKVILGHAKRSTTDSYIHVDRGELHEEFQKLLDWRRAQMTKIKTIKAGEFEIIQAEGA